MAHDYPLLLNVRDRAILIVGGGEVAARKAQGLIDSGATAIRVVSPDFCSSLSAQVQRIRETYDRRHLADADLVFAATNDAKVNDAVVKDAREMGIWVCRADADDDNAGDFATPAMIRRGPILVTVSTGGSPALSAKVRDAIEAAIDPRWIEMAKVMQMIRPRLRSIPSLAISRRREIFRALASDESMDVLEKGDRAALCEWLKRRFPEINQLDLSN